MFGHENDELFTLAVKKLQGKFDDDDRAEIKDYLRTYVAKDIRGLLTYHVLNLMLKANLAVIEQELMKLLLSGVINLLNVPMRSMLEEILSVCRIRALCDDPSFDVDTGYDLALSDFALLQDIVWQAREKKAGLIFETWADYAPHLFILF